VILAEQLLEAGLTHLATVPYDEKSVVGHLPPVVSMRPKSSQVACAIDFLML
jgi:hypothetical protein